MKQQGFSFIEIIISLFILSMGLLALARFQVQLLRLDLQNYYHTQINTRLASMANRLKIQPTYPKLQEKYWQQVNQQILANSKSSVQKNTIQLQFQHYQGKLVL